MKIKKIELGTYSLSLHKPFKTALRIVNSMESIVIKITISNGLIGYGETSPTEAITGDTRESIISSLEIFKSAAIGEKLTLNNLPKMLSDNSRYNNSARSAIEIAAYDILAQNDSMPLYGYLGGKKIHFKTGTTISLNPVEDMVSDSLDALKQGFDSLKIKLGDNPDEDTERIRAIREAVGDSISLKLDANQGWSPDDTVQFLERLNKYGVEIELLEQPVPKDDLVGLRYIKERSKVPILADESVFSPEDARAILKMDAVDMINIKLDKCGGIAGALEIADICCEYNAKCMIGCMMEGAISVGAAAHVASARNDTIVMRDLDAPILCQGSVIIDGGVVFEGSDITLVNKPGLGIESVHGVEWLT